MHWKVRRDFLSRVEIFKGLGRRELKAVAKSCSENDFESGEFLCHQGDRGIAAFLIVSGNIEIINVSDETEEETVIATLGQGTFVGELSLIDGANRVASVKAKGDVRVLTLTQWAMQGLIQNKPAIAAAMLPVVIKRFRETTNELRKANAKSEQSRLSTFH